MFCVNLPINTNFFDNNSIKTFTQACNKASETLKSNLVSKYQNLDFENLRKFKDLDLTKSKSDTNLSNTNTSTPNADPSYSVITTTTTPSLISKFINSDKKVMVHEMIENLNINLKKTKSFVEQKVQIMLESLEQPQVSLFDKSTAQIIDELFDVSSIDDYSWYDSDEESIFESPAPTSIELFQETINAGTSQEILGDLKSSNTSIQTRLCLSSPTESVGVNSLHSLLSKHEDFEENIQSCGSIASLALLSESKLSEYTNSNKIEHNYHANIGTKYDKEFKNCFIGILKYIDFTKYLNYQLSTEQKRLILNGQQTQLVHFESTVVSNGAKSANIYLTLEVEDSNGFNQLAYQPIYDSSQQEYEEIKRLIDEECRQYEQEAEYQQYKHEYQTQEKQEQVRWQQLNKIFGSTDEMVVGEIEYYWFVDNSFAKISFIDECVVEFIDYYDHLYQNNKYENSNNGFNNYNSYNQDTFGTEENIRDAFDFNDNEFEFDIDSPFNEYTSPIGQTYEEQLEGFLSADSDGDESNTYDSDLLYLNNEHQFTEEPFNYDTNYVSQFFKRVEKELLSVKVSILDTAPYVYEFFNLIEKDQNQRELEAKATAVSMEYIWLKLHEILTIKSGNQQSKLFELSELEITTSNNEDFVKSLTDTTKESKRKRKIPNHDRKPHPKRFINSNFH